MGKKKNLSTEIRRLIIEGKRNGISNRQLGHQFHCSEKAVRDLIKREAETGNVHDRHRSGRPRKIAIRQERTIVRSCLKDRRRTARQHQQELHQINGPHVSLTTIRRILRKNGLRGGIAIKKPVLSWPSQSPDLNRIENLWNEVDSAVKEAAPSTVAKLEVELKKAWATIPSSKCARLVASMPRRCAAVIKSRGYVTKY